MSKVNSLYILERLDDERREHIHTFLVRAPTPPQARKLACDADSEFGDVWLSGNTAKLTNIGTALHKKIGVLMQEDTYW